MQAIIKQITMTQKHRRRIRRGAFSLTLLLLSAQLTGCLGRDRGGTLTRKGMQALESRDYAGALEDFDQAVSGGEDQVMAYRGLGITLMGMAKYPEAVEAFEKALEATDTRMEETVRDLKLYQISARYKAQLYSEVISDCTRMLEEEERLEPCFYLGASYLAMKDQEQAKTYFDRAAALRPEDYSLYLQIYELYEKQNLSAAGDEYLQRALGLVPENTEGYYHIGRIYFYLGQYQEAKEALIRPVEEKYLPALKLMGEIYLALGDSGHALSTYETLLKENGESAAAYNGLALCAIASQEYDEALGYIDKGLALEDPEGRQQLLFNQIVALERKLDFAGALAKAEIYAGLYPSDEAGRQELAFLNTRRK